MECSTLALLLVSLLVVTLGIIRRMLHRRMDRRGYPLPPGPTPLPLLGSALSILRNLQRVWLTYTEWRERYGDVMYVRLLDNDVIILNSTSVATALLEKRSRIYSDRPFISTAIPYGHDCNFAIARYGKHWRLCRRMFQQTFRADAVRTVGPMQFRRAHELVLNMIEDPDAYPFHFSTYSAAVGTSVVYGYEPSARNDHMVSIIDRYLQASAPGWAIEMTALLKAFPLVLGIPDWLLGSWIRREAKEAYAWRNKMVDTPYRYVRERMASDDHVNTSMVSDHVSRMEALDGSHRSEYEMAVKHAAATAFIGSVETTSSTLMVFTLAMVENAHVWKRAQAEIDAVVGTGRLPDFDDRPSLPYVDAVVRETFRWRPVLPLGIPHAAVCSDIYEGYYIPKGAIVFVNAWAISRDRNRYPDGDKFMPERFLDENGALTDDEPDFIFGFGRRRCPGRHAANASVWSAIVTMLATLDFNRAKDVDGNDIPFKVTFKNGMTHRPRPFPCRFVLRAHVSKEVLGHVLET